MTRILCLTGAILLGLLALLVLPPEFACGRQTSAIPLVRCKEYYDAARTWATVRGDLPARLEDMQAPLLAGEREFQVIVDDPWGRPYVLERAGTDVCVRCVGADGRAGTDDDITWPER